MHVKFHEDVIVAAKLLPFDCPNINEFGVMPMHIHSDAHEYSVECP